MGLAFDTVYYACGSGGTGAGLALGMHYSSLPAELVGLCVDDTPAEFFEKIDGIYGGLGLSGLRSETIMRLEQHIGLGYARSTAEELQYITEVSDRVNNPPVTLQYRSTTLHQVSYQIQSLFFESDNRR